MNDFFWSLDETVLDFVQRPLTILGIAFGILFLAAVVFSVRSRRGS